MPKEQVVGFYVFVLVSCILVPIAILSILCVLLFLSSRHLLFLVSVSRLQPCLFLLFRFCLSSSPLAASRRFPILTLLPISPP